MSQVQRIVICGKSVFLMAIEAGLAALPGIEVLRFDPYLSDAIARIVSIAPDVVILERGGDDGGLTRALQSRSLLLVELDVERSTVTLLTGREVSVSGAADLIELIKASHNADDRESQARVSGKLAPTLTR